MRYNLKGSTNQDLVSVIFENRNVDVREKECFLNPDKVCVSNPEIYKNMDKAYDVLIRNINENAHILIVVDSDADGYCSSATLINYLRLSLKYTNISYIMHTEKKHGLTKEVISDILRLKPDLVIMPDAGSNDFEGHDTLVSNGIELIILDHHECESYSNSAIVVNNQMNEAGNKTLSGGGMVLKFIEYIDIKLNMNHSEFYYDLVAVSLVADSMLMTESETRYYVMNGINTINNPFLRKLSECKIESNFDFISYTVAPVINAIIRVGSEKDKQDLFDALICENREETIKLRGKGEVDLPLSEYIIKIADRLKSKQTRDIKKILEDEETIIITENFPITFMIHENEDVQSLSGLIASRLVDKYGKPALVLKKNNNGKDVVLGGSGRSTNTFLTFKDYLIDTSKFIFCEGHQGAFGCQIYENELSSLLRILLNQKIDNEDFSISVDKAYADGKVPATDIITINNLKQYWCKGFEKPKFFIRLNNISASSIATMGASGNSIKISNNHISYVKFKCTQEELDVLLSKGKKDIEIIGTFNINEWNGRTFPQVMIETLEVVASEMVNDVDFNVFNAFGV